MYKLNYTYQQTDNRDFKFSNNNLSINTTSFELKINKIYDQSQLGSCVSNGIATCIDYINNTINPSRLYIYFNGRLISKLSSLEDTGLTIRDGCKSVAKYNTCSETEWPYNINEFSTVPNLNCYINSYKYLNYKYESVNQDINSIKTTLLNNYPILFGFDVYNSFFYNTVTTTGMVQLPNTQTDILLGAHCCVIIGFNDTNQTFKCVNSWGTNWGDNGFFYMPYSYLLDNNLAGDLWIISFTNPSLEKKKKINKKILRKIFIRKKK
jgi:C1A family cysteine protease